jgi:DNA-binding MarR family transcriptional regulator
MAQHDIDRVVAAVREGPAHAGLYRDLVRRSRVAISPAESWVLWHAGARGPISADALAAKLGLDPIELRELFDALSRRGYLRPDAQGLPDLTAKGRDALVTLIKAGQAEVARLIRGREPADESEHTRALRRLTHAALMTMPATDPTRRPGRVQAAGRA